MKSEKPPINVPTAAYDEEELAIDTGINLFAARTRAGMTQAQLAKKLNTYQSAIARIENGRTLPSLRLLMRVAKIMKTGVIAPSYETLSSVVSPLEVTVSASSAGTNLKLKEVENNSPVIYA